MGTAKSFYMLRNSFKVVGMSSLKCGQKSLQENVLLYVQNFSPKGATRAEWRFIGVLTGETLPVSTKQLWLKDTLSDPPNTLRCDGNPAMNRWSTTWWQQEAVTYCSFQVERVHLRSSLNTHQNLMMLACSGGWGFAMKQEAVFEGFGKLEKSWNLAETCSVLKALRFYGSGHWILQNGSTFQLWNLAASCNVSRCTKHLLELNSKPRRKAAILNLKYNFGRLPGISSDQHDLWWVQSKDLGDVKLWSFWIFVK